MDFKKAWINESVWRPLQLGALGLIGLTIGGTLFLSGTLMAQSESTATGRIYLEGARQAELGYSRVVVTRGGDMIWLSGMSGPRDADGQPITDFKEQARQAYRNLDATLREVGSDLSDIVSVTVFLGDARHYEAFTEVRREFFPDARYPASTLITNASFVRPEVRLLLQAVAIVDG
jgi:2-iminobutanoate/2-iminopropanoate deaminase